jgi:hypothetical protein
MSTKTIPYVGDTIPVSGCDCCGTENPFHADHCPELYDAETIRVFRAAPVAIGICLWCADACGGEYCSDDCYNNARQSVTYIDADLVVGGGCHA